MASIFSLVYYLRVKKTHTLSYILDWFDDTSNFKYSSLFVRALMKKFYDLDGYGI